MYGCLVGVVTQYPNRAWFAALGLGCLGISAAGMELQHLLRLAPCPYCIFQRLLYMLIGVVAIMGALLPAVGPLWLTLIIGMSVIGLGVAAYQSWMQVYPELASECGFTDPNVIERLVDWLGMQWPTLFLATGFCSSKEWVFLGLSMANWSLLFFCSVGLLALILLQARKSAE
jgi:protein dithiol:quinone oxidoreductase